jgi:hypothetical protein
METRNLKWVMAKQAVDPTPALTIKKVGFGEGDNVATPDDTTLTRPYIKNISGFTVNSDGSFTVSYLLDYTEANGKTIKEVGLYCEDGTTLVVREARDTIIKSIDKAIEGSMTINQGA